MKTVCIENGEIARNKTEQKEIADRWFYHHPDYMYVDFVDYKTLSECKGRIYNPEYYTKWMDNYKRD